MRLFEPMQPWPADAKFTRRFCKKMRTRFAIRRHRLATLAGVQSYDLGRWEAGVLHPKHERFVRDVSRALRDAVLLSAQDTVRAIAPEPQA